MALQHLRSSTAHKRPTPAAMSDGQLAINTNADSPGLFFKDSTGALTKVGPVHVGTTAPNASPASGGETGNTVGEQWLDTTGGTYVFKVWDGSAWRSETGTFVDVNGDTMTGALGIIAGDAATPGLFVSGDTNTGIYSPGADQLAISTNGTGRLFVDSSGKLGLGTATPSAKLQVVGGNAGNCLIDNDGSQYTQLLLQRDSTANTGGDLLIDGTAGEFQIRSLVGPLCFHTSNPAGTNAERARIDSSGRLLVGTSTARSNFHGGGVAYQQQLEGISYFTSAPAFICNSNSAAHGPHVTLARSRGASVGSNTVVQSGDVIGVLNFQGNDGTNFVNCARILTEVDGTPGANDMPGRLVFSTSADGSSSPTERMRIANNGDVTTTGTSSFNLANVGFTARSGDSVSITRNAGTVLELNRGTNDGGLVAFYQAAALEGVISVSGSTVTYGGGHLARWSQLLNDEDPSGILKGTVMSNLDEMCEWGEEDNEQLNKTKVSDVEGDPNVAGVFVSTSFDDVGPLDFFVAMTGDMIIRIAQGVTVQRGDLLMSAGDGTAKPQDDDIIRSKTVAKVTSTHVTCTYDDGSYCVPCVLMAC